MVGLRLSWIKIASRVPRDQRDIQLNIYFSPPLDCFRWVSCGSLMLIHHLSWLLQPKVWRLWVIFISICVYNLTREKVVEEPALNVCIHIFLSYIYEFNYFYNSNFSIIQLSLHYFYNLNFFKFIFFNYYSINFII